jgi:hypothetical protein
MAYIDFQLINKKGKQKLLFFLNFIANNNFFRFFLLDSITYLYEHLPKVDISSGTSATMILKSAIFGDGTLIYLHRLYMNCSLQNSIVIDGFRALTFESVNRGHKVQ